MRNLAFSFLFGIASIYTFNACNRNETEHYDHYECPMKCEGDKVYDKPDTCPVCEMDLEGKEENKSK